MKKNTLPGDRFFNRLRKKEFSRLDKLGQTYLDYTGGNIYPQCLLDKHYKYLKNAVYGNPHSLNPASILSERMISQTRKKVIDFFNAGDYHCIFTNNATGALQIVGECYPFTDGIFLLTVDNHNSVNGIREYCQARSGHVVYSPMCSEDLSIDESALNNNLQGFPSQTNKLFAFPAQSNVSGIQHSLSWIKKAKDAGWDVLLDAAAFAPCSRLDLSLYRPDFVSISFYKIFGYPTGIGCLLVKKTAFDKLKKPWFSGGTILLSAVKHQDRFLKLDHEKFENGTVNYLDIPAITNGLDFINKIGIDMIHRRIKQLSAFILAEITKLKHDNGLPAIRLYGPHNTENRGGTFLMNFLDTNGQFYPPDYIEKLANGSMISLRTGCFCNPGIDELNHDISAETLKKYFAGRTSGDYFDMINFVGKIRGAVRLSVGLSTTIRDIEKFIQFATTLLNRAFEKNYLWGNEGLASNFEKAAVHSKNIFLSRLLEPSRH